MEDKLSGIITGQEKIKSGFVAIIGAPNVGKSTLLNQILGQKVSITCPKPQTTRNRIVGIYTSQTSQIVFLDTPGIYTYKKDKLDEFMVKTALKAASDVDVICLMVEATAKKNTHDLNVIKQISKVSAPTILLINKIDLIKRQLLLPIIDKYKDLGSFEAVIPISALYKDGIDRLISEIEKLLPYGPKYYPDDMWTDQPERFIAAEIIREKIFHLLREEVPYAVAVTIDYFEEVPDRNLLRIGATIHVEKKSQKAIIIGEKGRMLKEIGSKARMELEHIFGTRIFLELWVRVEKKWRRDEKVLRKFGYR
ncbi:MAG: GTPase Era [Deltaproteobacteria bacterium]|nr:MAG: GTPase Era [Deltaproteobacteria bacterium]